jgi:saccharopine dehydrogenase-like NADP-dependent oxidoreductase
MGTILIVGGTGEVGRRLAAALRPEHRDRVVVGGRHPTGAAADQPALRIDVDDPASIDAALDGVDLVVACVRQREPHLLRAAVRRGVAYTSIASPWLPWPEIAELHGEARLSGARVILATGIEPGISSALARLCAERAGGVETIETALLLSLGDAYGADSMAFLMEELAEPYEITVEGRPRRTFAFATSRKVRFPAPVGERRAYAIPFRDQRYYPHTLGARTAVARLAVDPPWVGRAVALLTRLGGRGLAGRGGAEGRVAHVVERLRARHAGEDRFALVVEARGPGGVARAELAGRGQAQATAAGAAAVVEALVAGEVRPGVWLVEQALDPRRFLERLLRHGLVPTIEGGPLAW